MMKKNLLLLSDCLKRRVKNTIIVYINQTNINFCKEKRQVNC